MAIVKGWDNGWKIIRELIDEGWVVGKFYYSSATDEMRIVCNKFGEYIYDVKPTKGVKI